MNNWKIKALIGVMYLFPAFCLYKISLCIGGWKTMMSALPFALACTIVYCVAFMAWFDVCKTIWKKMPNKTGLFIR